MPAKKLIYKLQEFFDPTPKSKKGEKVDDWLRRIDLKYALRYTKMMYSMRIEVDEEEEKKKLAEYKHPKDKKIIKEAFELTRLVNIQSARLYEMVQVRKRVEEQMRSSN